MKTINGRDLLIACGDVARKLGPPAELPTPRVSEVIEAVGAAHDIPPPVLAHVFHSVLAAMQDALAEYQGDAPS